MTQSTQHAAKSGEVSQLKINAEDFNKVTEGKATVLAPKEDKVFYNHIQQFNRDLSVMAIRVWQKQYMTSAKGLKEVRHKRKLESPGGGEKRVKPTENGPANQGLEASEKVGKSTDNEKASAAIEEAGPQGETTKPAVETNKPEANATLSTKAATHNETLHSENQQNGANTDAAPGIPPFTRILEALSATGLRALRYGHEIPHVSKIVANDLSADAVQAISRSIAYNKLDGVVEAHKGDAVAYMGLIAEKERFHIIDLDPYGTAAPFLDLALHAVRDNGMLMITCTDAGVLAGNGYPEKCYALYGGSNLGNTPMGLETNHEAGLRLMLGALSRTAAKYKKAIEPVLSLSIDYYFRVFVKVTTAPLAVKELALTSMLVYHCTGCGHRVEQPLGRRLDSKFQTPRVTLPGLLCEYCERPFHLAGPMWGGQLHLEEFVDLLLDENAKAAADVYNTRERIKGMVTLAKHELREPFYWSLNQLLSFVRAPPISIDEFARAAGNLGAKVSLTHAKKNCVKTDASYDQVLAILVAWLRRSNEKLVVEHEAKIEALTVESGDNAAQIAKLRAKVDALRANLAGNPNLSEGMVGWKLLEKLPPVEVDFDSANPEADRIGRLRRLKMVRYQENPKNWGPKARPSGN